MDKTEFYKLIINLKETNPKFSGLLEAIQDKFDEDVPDITEDEKQALKRLPQQYLKRMQQSDGEWTTQLHKWAELCVPEILDLPPLFLSFKNGYGDTILMSFTVGATGAFDEVVKYDLIEKLLHLDLSYEDTTIGTDGKETTELKNVFEDTDYKGQTVIDYLFDFAYSMGVYENTEPDLKLQQKLEDCVNS